MARTLVIKGANFSENKIETVSFGSIPCTSVLLDESTISVSSIGGTETLTATVTPVNTTDTVVWSTSDSSVAIVSGGVVTATGVGTATITVTCGNYTATCTCTVNVALTFTYMLGRFTDLPSNRQYIRVNGSFNEYATAYSSETLTGKKRIVDMVAYQSMWAAPLAPGATKINFTIPSTHRVTVFFVDNDTASSTSGMSDYATMISGDANSYDSSVALGSREVTIPTGANAIVFTIQYPGSGNTVTDETMQSITAIQS